MTVLVELAPPPIAADAVQMVDDVEQLKTYNMCSCSAGDDAPYN